MTPSEQVSLSEYTLPQVSGETPDWQTRLNSDFRAGSLQSWLSATAQDEEKFRFMVLQRGSSQAHASPFAEKNNTSGNAETQIKLASVPDFGWWNGRQKSAPSGALMVLAGMRFPDAFARNMFVEATKEHGVYCRDHEPDTLVYGLGVVQHAGGFGTPVVVGDLMACMICRDNAAVEKHRDDPRHLALGQRVQDAGIVVAAIFSRTYTLNGDGFLK